MKCVINNLKKSDTWNIKLTTAINFISSKNANEEHLMHSSRDSIEIMPHDKAYEATVDCQYLELFWYLKQMSFAIHLRQTITRYL